MIIAFSAQAHTAAVPFVSKAAPNQSCNWQCLIVDVIIEL